MKAIRYGGSVDISEWTLDVFTEAEAAFNGALAQIIKDGVNQALECALTEEAPIVFEDDGTFLLHVPLSNEALTTDPTFKFDLVANVAEEISFHTPLTEDAEADEDRDHLNRIRATLIKAVVLLDRALG